MIGLLWSVNKLLLSSQFIVGMLWVVFHGPWNLILSFLHFSWWFSFAVRFLDRSFLFPPLILHESLPLFCLLALVISFRCLIFDLLSLGIPAFPHLHFPSFAKAMLPPFSSILLLFFIWQCFVLCLIAFFFVSFGTDWLHHLFIYLSSLSWKVLGSLSYLFFGVYVCFLQVILCLAVAY